MQGSIYPFSLELLLCTMCLSMLDIFIDDNIIIDILMFIIYQFVEVQM